MKAKRIIQAKMKQWPYGLVSIVMALSAFGAYTSMYAFRKAFASATFEGLQFLDIDYKVWLVIFQVAGYTCSKFYGIRFISALQGDKRGGAVLTLIGISWLSLLFFALTPAPWNIIFLFVNGFPLGMIWGLIFGYLEGRRTTEFMAAVMSVSLIFASGFVKTIGRTLITAYDVSEYWMPFLTGLIFVLPILFFVGLLECLPGPTAEDKLSRSERKPMNTTDRNNFARAFLPGIVSTLVIYILLTITRDIRDNFEVEIWNELDVKSTNIYTVIDSAIALVVLAVISLLILIKNNAKAFTVIHALIISGCILAGASTLLFDWHYIDAITWMTLAGLGLYLAYIPYNAIFFERMIATFKCKGNVGFVMYIADAAGYLGSIAVLVFKEFGSSDRVSWNYFFKEGLLYVSVVGGLAAVFSLIYFTQKRYQEKKVNNVIQILPV